MMIKLLGVFSLALFLSACTHPVGPTTSSGPAPQNFYINQNFPNPFFDSTSVPYGVPSSGGSGGYVSLLIFDKYQNLVRTLALNNHHPAGSFTAFWDGRDENFKRVPPGIYIIELYGSSPNTFISRITAVRLK